MKIILHGNPLSTQYIYKATCLGRFARVYMSKAGKERKEKYKEEAKKQYKGKIISGDCEAKVILFFGDKRRRDIDNHNKLWMDILEGIVYKNDTQIQKLTIYKNFDKENPRIEIEIEKL